MIKTQNLNWIHIYNDVDLINAFGGYRGIPRLYIIDKQGKIIYVNQIDETYDFELEKFKKIVEARYMD